MLSRIKISTSLVVLVVPFGLMQVVVAAVSYYNLRSGTELNQSVQLVNQQRNNLNRAATRYAYHSLLTMITPLMDSAKQTLTEAEKQFKTYSTMPAGDSREQLLHERTIQAFNGLTETAAGTARRHAAISGDYRREDSYRGPRSAAAAATENVGAGVLLSAE